MHTGEGSEHEEEHSLNCGERGAAENFSEDDGRARHGGDQHGEEEALLAVFDERHHRENGGEEYDHDERAGIEIVAVMLLPLASAGAERSAEAGADYHPEHERGCEHADYARLLAIEAYNLTPPQRKCGQEHASGGRRNRSRQGGGLSGHEVQLAFAAGGLAAGATAFFLPIMPESRISQYALSMKIPESVSRIRLMNRPTTVVIMPFVSVHATPSSGRMPSTRERASIIEIKLPPVAFRIRMYFRAVVFFAPEFVPGAADENVFESRLAHRNRLDLSGKGLDDLGDEAVRALALHAHLIFQNCSVDVKASPDTLGEQSRIMCGIQENHVTADFTLQLRGRTQRYQVAFIHNGEAITTLGLFHEVRGDQHRYMFFVAQGGQVLPE